MALKLLLFSALLCYATVSAGNRRYSPGARRVLDALGRMGGRDILSGAFGGYTGISGKARFSLDHANQLKQSTGKFPMIYGLDCSHGWDTTQNYKEPDLINCYDPQAIEYGKRGAIIAISHHLPNPVFAGNRDGAGKGAFKTAIYNNDYAAIVGPQRSAQRDRWYNMMKKIADGLKAYKAHGITVLYRPFHEMNGDWFWWGAEPGKPNDGVRRDLYKKLWIDLFNFMQGQGMDNLLWVYSPDKTRGNRNAFYPGDYYVDIVGLDGYTDNPWDRQIEEAYREVTSIRKPFGFAEIGPSTVDLNHGDNYGRSNLNYKQFLDAIVSKYPKTTFFVPWNNQWSAPNNVDARGAYNNPKVRNLGEFRI